MASSLKMNRPRTLEFVLKAGLCLWFFAVRLDGHIRRVLAVESLGGNASPVSPTGNEVTAKEPKFVLGVMVDGGRHEFSMEWLQTFMTDMHRMGFNTIHLRLTNDQRFAVEIHEEHSNAPFHSTKRPSKGWTPRNLELLSQHAESLHSMTVLPEISIPWFAGSWMLPPPPCPNYICSVERKLPLKGMNIPLDIYHPKLNGTLRKVLKGVLGSLGKPSLLHLGEYHASSEYTTKHHRNCWEEASTNESSMRMDDWVKSLTDHSNALERTLDGILSNDLDYRPQKIRTFRDVNEFEEYHRGSTPTSVPTVAYFQDLSVATKNETLFGHPYMLQPKELDMATTLSKDHPSGWEVYQQTRKILQNHRHEYFRGMIVSTEAMHPDWFETRNVKGRLLAISMAAKEFVDANDQRKSETPSLYNSREEFEHDYLQRCQEIFPTVEENKESASFHLCHRFGGLLPPRANDNATVAEEFRATEEEYKRQYRKQWEDWADQKCQELTEDQNQLELVSPSPSEIRSVHDDAFADFWKDLEEPSSALDRHQIAPQEESFFLPVENPNELSKTDQSSHEIIPIRGLIVDLVEDQIPTEALKNMIKDLMAPLGLNTLQLSLMNRFGSVLGFEASSASNRHYLYHLHPKPHHNKDYPLSQRSLADVVKFGNRLGVDLLPEISITTEATGWYRAGFLVDCPYTLCSASSEGNSEERYGQQQPLPLLGIPNDIRQGALLPVILQVIKQIFQTFSTSPYLHLGSDEREASRSCWMETGKNQTAQRLLSEYDRFERTLLRILETKKWYNTKSTIIRWENQEGIAYPNRVGGITHYRYTSPADILPFFNNTATKVNSIDADGQMDDSWQNLTFGSLSIPSQGESNSDPWKVYLETRQWSRLRPKGLLAKISFQQMRGHRKTAQAANVRITDSQKQSLLAFAIGLSPNIPLLEDAASLEFHTTALCYNLTTGAHSTTKTAHVLCSPYTTNNKAGTSNEERRLEEFLHPPTRDAVSRMSILCNAMTRSVSRRVMRSRREITFE